MGTFLTRFDTQNIMVLTKYFNTITVRIYTRFAPRGVLTLSRYAGVSSQYRRNASFPCAAEPALEMSCKAESKGLRAAKRSALRK